MDESLKKAVKENAIKLDEHHKKHCEGSECGISLYLLRLVLEEAGIVLTEDEKKSFM